MIAIIAAVLIFGSLICFYLLSRKSPSVLQNSSINILEKKESPHGSVWVWEKDNKIRCLSFVEPPVTPSNLIEKENPRKIIEEYIRIFLAVLFINSSPKKILCLGLGIGKIQSSLNILLPDVNVVTVDINPALPELTEKYFGYKKNERNNIVIQDALEYVTQCSDDHYDIVFVDVFGTDYIPPHILDNKFFTEIHRILHKNGTVVMQSWSSSKTYEKEGNLMKSNFNAFYNFEKNGSRIMMGSKKGYPSLLDVRQKADQWKSRLSILGVNGKVLYNYFESYYRTHSLV
jgi:predicted O-methyltransferase YrrM